MPDSLAHDPMLADAIRLHHAGRVAEALSLYDRVLSSAPLNFSALHFSGVLHTQEGNHAEACARLGAAVRAVPSSAVALRDLGRALIDARKFEEAIGCCRRAVQIEPNSAEAYCDMGTAFGALERYEQAAAAFGEALRLKRDFPSAHINLGIVLMRIERYGEAMGCFERALALQPHSGNSLRLLSYLSKQICDWSALADLDRRIVEAVRGGVAGVTPFTTVIGPSTPADQLRAARSHLRSMKIEALPPIRRGQRHRHERIRVGYLSADFHDHATSYLMAGLFERHDRAKFEISAYSFGPDQKDQSRARLMKAFDRFFDIRPLRDVDAARLLAAHEIDIAVDLKGYTGGARPAILAHRPAPIQVSYLGYPGTMGADFIDYVVADPIAIPIDEQAFFTEKIVHLPDCYQANDRERPIAERTPSRAECGLPERGFVFASFNSGLKLTPAFFDIWMRLLKTVPNSVLWLLRDNPWVEANLRKEATARGISPDRLVFAPRVALADHLARNRLADLFLDTLPYNAHTTASDALWAGLPVVSCIGTTFAGRVAASLLSAVGLPELITRSLEEYEALARHLASDPARLAGIRAKLARNRLATPLFDTDRFRRHLEAAYLEMWRIQQRGEKPRAFVVGSGDG